MTNWQSEINSISNALKHIWEFSDYSDVTFFFGDPPNRKIIKAHKLVLAMRSDVFKTMFFGIVQENGSDIYVVDIKEHIFKVMLKYIYTDTFNVESVSDMISVFYAAHKYHILPLMNICREKIQSKLSGNNVCEVFPTVRLLEDEILINKCETVIPYYSKDVTESESFTKLPSDAIEYLVRENKITLNQPDLYRAILKWAKFQLEKSKGYSEEETEEEEEEKQSANKWSNKTDICKKFRSVMNPFLPYINFLSMKLEEFIKLPDLLMVLTKKEIVHIALNISKVQNIPLPDWFGTALKTK